MAAPVFSYTKVTHAKSYPGIAPTRPELSTAGKAILITGATGGIGRATAASFAFSNPRALILLGRRAHLLTQTANSISSSFPNITIQTHTVDLCDAPKLKEVMKQVALEFNGIDALIHCAGVLPPVSPLLHSDPATFLEQSYKTTIVGTLSAAQAVVLANQAANNNLDRPVTFVNLTTAGILFPPFAGMGAYVSVKMAAVKLLQCFAVENPQVRLHHVHPGFLETDMSAQLAEKIKLPFAFDDVSLPSDFLVWIVSREAAFLKDKIVFAAWDVDELKAREKEIVGRGVPGSGELWLGYQGFPRFVDGEEMKTQ